jgi:hypothetical protein
MKKTLCLFLLLVLLLAGCQRASADVEALAPSDLAQQLLKAIDDADELTMADRDYMETNFPAIADQGVVYFGSDDDVCEFGIFQFASTAAASAAEAQIKSYIETEKEALTSLSALYPSDDLNERLWCYNHAQIGRIGETVYYLIMDAESLADAERALKAIR